MSHTTNRASRTHAGRISDRDATYYTALDELEPRDDDDGKQRSGSYVYFAHSPTIRRVKIGLTRHDPARRVERLRHSLPVVKDLALVGAIDGGRVVEKLVHERFAAARKGGEWFDDSILGDVAQLVREDAEWFG